MKTKLLIVCLLVAGISFGQKKEIKKAYKAAESGKFQEAKDLLSTINESSVDGDLKAQIIQQIEQLQLSNSVKLLGFQPQEKIAQLLNDADAFLLPSVVAKNGDMEGIPVALMEAMAMGLITISTYHSGIPELISHNESGLLAQEHAPIELADSIERLVNGQIDIEKMRATAKEKVEQNFEQSKLYTQLLDILVTLNEH